MCDYVWGQETMVPVHEGRVQSEAGMWNNKNGMCYMQSIPQTHQFFRLVFWKEAADNVKLTSGKGVEKNHFTRLNVIQPC